MNKEEEHRQGRSRAKHVTMKGRRQAEEAVWLGEGSEVRGYGEEVTRSGTQMERLGYGRAEIFVHSERITGNNISEDLEKK